MMDNRRSLRPGPAGMALGMLLLLAAGRAHAHGAAAPVRVRFQLRAECTCASCGFALQDQLHKLRGVSRVDLSPRDRMVTLTVDESQTTLSRVAAALSGTELGKRSALIADLGPAPAGPEVAARAQVEGVRHAEVDRKKNRLLLDLSDRGSFTTTELTTALAKAGVSVRLDAGARTASLQP
jgi:copper chaperone CopZ